jgi:hypothetical protein
MASSKRFTRFLEERRGPRLAGCEFDAGNISRVIHTHEQDRPPAVIYHRNDSGQMIAFGFRLRGRDHLLGGRQSEHLLFCELRRGILRRKSER